MQKNKKELAEFLSEKLEYSPEFIYDLLKEFERKKFVNRQEEEHE